MVQKEEEKSEEEKPLRKESTISSTIIACQPRKTMETTRKRTSRALKEKNRRTTQKRGRGRLESITSTLTLEISKATEVSLLTLRPPWRPSRNRRAPPLIMGPLNHNIVTDGR